MGANIVVLFCVLIIEGYVESNCLFSRVGKPYKVETTSPD